MKCTERTTLRIDDNLKTRIRLLAIKNNFSMNKMFIYLTALFIQYFYSIGSWFSFGSGARYPFSMSL